MCSTRTVNRPSTREYQGSDSYFTVNEADYRGIGARWCSVEMHKLTILHIHRWAHYTCGCTLWCHVQPIVMTMVGSSVETCFETGVVAVVHLISVDSEEPNNSSEETESGASKHPSHGGRHRQQHRMSRVGQHRRDGPLHCADGVRRQYQKRKEETIGRRVGRYRLLFQRYSYFFGYCRLLIFRTEMSRFYCFTVSYRIAT